MISTKIFLTLKVKVIESWNFVCPNIFKKCAWRPNFSHFCSEMTKISMSKLTFACPTWRSSDCMFLFFYITTQYGSFRQIFLLTQSLKFKLLLQIVCLRRLRLCKKVHIRMLQLLLCPTWNVPTWRINHTSPTLPEQSFRIISRLPPQHSICNLDTKSTPCAPS